MFGRLIMSKIFDLGNATLNDFVETLLAAEGDDHILEIGFGTGKLIQGMSKAIRHGLIEGIDQSPTMVEMARRRNARAISQGRVILKEGEFDRMDFPEAHFDKVSSTNTIYFWPEPEKTIRKIHRLLKPGGKLILAFEDQKQLAPKNLDSAVFRIYDEQELAEMLRGNGFSNAVKIHTRTVKAKQFHCCVTVK